ncbi:MAG: hypothetical protein ABI267_03650 [Ginsengibacter sp.]
MSAETTKTFPTFQLNLFGDANAFVKCWSSLYNYPKYDLYKSTVTKSEFAEGDLRLLFDWKNGMNLSSKKGQSFLNQILQHQELIYELKKNFDQDKFEKSFGKISAVWQIFLLHIIRPSSCPIFDQHVYRAFMFIQNQDEKTLPFVQTAKLKIFYEQYLPFFLDMLELADEYDHFEIDKALWTFGKMLKEYPGLVKVTM